MRRVDPARTIFLAGAAGAIGRRLCRLLVEAGWRVYGTTRRPERAAALRALGVEPVIVDVLDAQRLTEAVAESQPSILIHQLTDLPPGLDPLRMAEARPRNARLRDIGTRNVVAAAAACGAERLIAQSLAFAYAPGPRPFDESSPLDIAAPDSAGGANARGIANLERQVLEGPCVGVVLRYGRFYGPGTGFDTPPAGAPVHVDAAADAARRAICRGTAGIYNVAEEDGTVSSAKARRELGWEPAFRIAG